MRRTTRPVPVRLPFPHGHAFNAWRENERRRVQRSRMVRHAFLIVLGLIVGGLIGLALPLPERSPAARTAVSVSGYAVSLSPLDSALTLSDCAAIWESGGQIDERCAF
jgi:hypothetical protein